MDARYAIRKAQLLEECQVAPEVFEQVIPRLHPFMEPFVDTLPGQSRSSPPLPGLPYPSPARFGDAGDQRRRVATSLDGG